MRDSLQLNLIQDYSQDFDPVFSTTNSTKLARNMANDKFINYVRRNLHYLEIGLDNVSVEKSCQFCTDSKSALIELAYAIQSCGAINHRKSGVKVNITLMESLFNVKIGNFYRTLQSMRVREKNRTIFFGQSVRKSGKANG